MLPAALLLLKAFDEKAGLAAPEAGFASSLAGSSLFCKPLEDPNVAGGGCVAVVGEGAAWWPEPKAG